MSSSVQRFAFVVSGPSVSHIGPGSSCYAPPSLPPPEDFPVMIDVHGNTVSRYGEPVWYIGGAPFNFGSDTNARIRRGLLLTEENSELLKRCIFWLMFGDRRSITIATLAAYHTQLKAVFAFCSNCSKPIRGSELPRHFSALDVSLANSIRPSMARGLVFLLDELWQARAHLGFVLLEPAQIAQLMKLIPEHNRSQTSFIPPRIWAYQAKRLHSFLEDFLGHKEKLEEALSRLLAAYRANYGELTSVLDTALSNRNPCRAEDAKRIRNCTYLDSFKEFAALQGIGDLIARWLFVGSESWDTRAQAPVQLFSQYLSAVGLVGTAYLQCFSGMRLSEAMSLRTNCLCVEIDPVLGEMHVLTGETGKTTEDDDARWLTAPAAAMAIEAMGAVARWRTDIAVERGDVPLTSMDIANPYLAQRAYEPWSTGTTNDKRRPTSFRPGGLAISKWSERVPGLFDEDELRITKEDEAYVLRFNANADMGQFRVGCVWSFSSHQYRRSAAIMMGASQVSLEAQQFQFKHLTRGQSSYYRLGARSLGLNKSFTTELVSTRYELVSIEIGLLKGPEFVSPISSARKDQVLNFYEIDSGDEIQRAVRQGFVAVKQTLFGVCTRRDSCPYGGHDNFVHCPDCNDALLSKRKRSSVAALGKSIAVRLIDVPQRTPLRIQLERKMGAIERFLDVTA